ncbi:uncharacterized protein LOC113281157 [Papaver somniferum]|uniref:uncharacterized protein LOC113281157 n=1 Tax=Papaver somniferum TaxID=3469 RepID=UPI000E70489F|nr:uncharacterized protein LOC113281157 [Papaver somniferum]
MDAGGCVYLDVKLQVEDVCQETATCQQKKTDLEASWKGTLGGSYSSSFKEEARRRYQRWMQEKLEEEAKSGRHVQSVLTEREMNIGGATKGGGRTMQSQGAWKLYAVSSLLEFFGPNRWRTMPYTKLRLRINTTTLQNLSKPHSPPLGPFQAKDTKAKSESPQDSRLLMKERGRTTFAFTSHLD